MKLIALPAFTDNYIWMLHDDHRAIVVDPGDAAPVLSALASSNLTLVGILVTHHHKDHIGGLQGLRSVLDGPIYAPAREPLPVPCTPLHGGEAVDLLGLRFEVIDVPGHTLGHIAYFHTPADGSAPLLFCGDVLFSAGCGRVVDGAMAQMHASLTKLALLPDETRVCCAHEYTLANLAFARTVEPLNAELVSHADWCAHQRMQGLPTLPTSLGRERQVNPYLRCHVPAVRDAAMAQAGAAAGHAPVDVFTALRRWKNDFK